MKSAVALFRGLFCQCLIVLLAGINLPDCAAQDLPKPPATPAPAATAKPAADKPAADAPPLAATQDAITMRYKRFEDTLNQLSEYLKKSDPQRAELLTRAFGKSQEGQVQEQLKRIAATLKDDRLGDAIEREEEVIAHMQAVLELLMSEDRRDEIEKERARIKDLIKDVDRLISKQTDARITTERGGDPKDLERDQKQVADGTQKLVDKIEGQDAKKNADKQKSGKNDSSGKKSDPKEGDSKDGDPKDGDKKDPKEIGRAHV